MQLVSSFSSPFVRLLRLSIVLRAMIICCAVVFISKLLTLTILHSANTESDEKAAANKDKKTSQPIIAPTTQNVQVDEEGMTLKLDFLNLTPQDIKVLESLFDAREKIKRKTSELVKKEDQLHIVEARVKQQLEELKRIQGTISGLLEKHDEQEEKKIVLMVKIYENMKPEQAAQIFNTLPEPRVLALLRRMKEVKSAAIMANMNPSQASYLTDRLLAERELK